MMDDNSKNMEALATEVSNSLDVSIPSKTSYEEMVNLLTGHVNHLIDKNFQGLLHLLYRIDIPENKLRDHLSNDDTGNSGRIIAEMMIERINQKMESRKKFAQPNNDIPDMEKW